MKLLTFNIHKGLSMFSRRRTLREIRLLLEQSEADIIALQEIGSRFLPFSEQRQFETQLEYLADSIWPHSAYVQNATYPQGHHGNAILSRYPIQDVQTMGLSLHSLEQRGLLHAKLETEKGPLHILCTHLNLLGHHRQHQMRMIYDYIRAKIPQDQPLALVGDFNDWLGKLQPNEGLVEVGRFASFPSFFPLLSLDRIFYRGLEIKKAEVLRDPRLAFVSDHLPLTAVFHDID